MNAAVSNTDREQALHADWVAGDDAAGRELLEIHIGVVSRFFITKAREDSADLTQRTIVRLMEVKQRFDGRGSFRAFALGVARFILLEYFRAKNRNAYVNLEEMSVARLSSSPSAKVAKMGNRERVLRAIQELSLEHQIVIELHYWEELRVEEIALATGVAEGTVKSRLYRARRALSASLGDLGDLREGR